MRMRKSYWNDVKKKMMKENEIGSVEMTNREREYDEKVGLNEKMK